MATVAREKFEENCGDVRRLLEIHGSLTTGTPGRQWGVEVLNKSAIVLLTAFWEAYCEDVAAEGLDYIVNEATDGSTLPKDIKKQVAAELKQDANELAVWDLVGDGWRSVLTSRMERIQEVRNRKLNTPKTGQINELFSSTLGVPEMSKTWHWSSMSVKNACAKLDRFVTLRGSIAHRGIGTTSVRKATVQDYFGHLQQLVNKTDNKVNSHLDSVTFDPDL